ncbi:MAG TPA: NUDIX domain-containing protein [Ignavibacteria bacterium]|nr:NUDIX domain-containing protein [Ignavibacteria bacterium]
MSRQPQNVLVLPFRVKEEAEYAMFKRTDMKIWQFVAGGVEGDETVLNGAKRETFEEAGIPVISKFYKLDSHFTVTADNFPKLWKSNKYSLYVVPVYCFAVECSGTEIIISDEHTDFCWGNFEKCNEMLYFSNDKTALWELDQRIKDNTLISI